MEVGLKRKELVFLHEWLKIVRKPQQSLRTDLLTLFSLIKMHVSESELKILLENIDPQNNKCQLTQQDLLRCFLVEEPKKKSKKDLIKAFQYVSGQTVDFNTLRQYFKDQGIDQLTIQSNLKSLLPFKNAQNQFDYREFAAKMYEQ